MSFVTVQNKCVRGNILYSLKIYDQLYFSKKLIHNKFIDLYYMYFDVFLIQKYHLNIFVFLADFNFFALTSTIDAFEA